MRNTVNASLFETNELIQYILFDNTRWDNTRWEINSGFLSATAGRGGRVYATHSSYIRFFLAMHRAHIELISIYETKLIKWSEYVRRS